MCGESQAPVYVHMCGAVKTDPVCILIHMCNAAQAAFCVCTHAWSDETDPECIFIHICNAA